MVVADSPAAMPAPSPLVWPCMLISRGAITRPAIVPLVTPIAVPLRTVWTIILPMALPGVFTAAIFCFTACWTEFLMALTFDDLNTYRTIPVGIAGFGTVYNTPFGTIFAACVVAVVPIGILVFIFRRFVISGLTSGAVKG